MGRLKILMLIPQLGYGGAEGSLLRLAEYLSRYADVTIALMARDYGDHGYSTAGGETKISIKLLDSVRAPGRGLTVHKVARWWRMLQETRTLKRNHDVAISFLSGANLLNALAGPKRKTVVSERGSKRHDEGMTTMQRFVWTRFLDPLIYRKSSLIVAASKGLAGEISRSSPRAADRTIALEGTIHAIELVEKADAHIDGAFQVLREFETVVAYGRLHVQKGFDVLLRAFAQVRRGRPAAKLLLIGDGPERDKLAALASDLGLIVGDRENAEKADVIFAGYQSDPLRFVRLGRVFTLTSRYEGLPNALIEALAGGVPVLAADCPWGPRSVLAADHDVIDIGPITSPKKLPHGTLMPTPDGEFSVDVWAKEIGEALQNPMHRRPRQVCLEAVQRFDIEVTGPRWLSSIQKILGDGGTPGSSASPSRIYTSNLGRGITDASRD